MVRGPEEAEGNLYDGLRHEPTALQESYRAAAKGAKLKAVQVNPGTVVVQAHAGRKRKRKVTNTIPNSYYVLNDNPVLSGEDVTNPQQGFDEGPAARASRT